MLEAFLYVYRTDTLKKMGINFFFWYQKHKVEFHDVEKTNRKIYNSSAVLNLTISPDISFSFPIKNVKWPQPVSFPEFLQLFTLFQQQHSLPQGDRWWWWTRALEKSLFYVFFFAHSKLLPAPSPQQCCSLWGCDLFSLCSSPHIVASRLARATWNAVKWKINMRPEIGYMCEMESSVQERREEV